ncbi:MAG: C2H2-type zinc finger protein [Planctomycetes bacterium]|nr:C2H2-type zinc finger protein [Planctomycetota bacterium]
MAKAKFTCEHCGRGFSMAAHLARHLSGGHGIAPAGGKKSGLKRGPKKGSWGGKRRGRQPAAIAKLGLGSMSADELAQVIVAARGEVQRRIVSLQEAIG